MCVQAQVPRCDTFLTATATQAHPLPMARKSIGCARPPLCPCSVPLLRTYCRLAPVARLPSIVTPRACRCVALKARKSVAHVAGAPTLTRLSRSRRSALTEATYAEQAGQGCLPTCPPASCLLAALDPPRSLARQLVCCEARAIATRAACDREPRVSACCVLLRAACEPRAMLCGLYRDKTRRSCRSRAASVCVSTVCTDT
jgi:hypothetical protein